jgi:hypothetical protein
VLAALSLAQPAVAGEGVALEVISVLATKSGQMFDPRLRHHRQHFVGDPFSSFSSYRLLRRQLRYVAWGGQARFNLPGPGELKVRPKMRESAGVSLNVALRGAQRRRLVDTSVCLQDHRLLLVGGQRHRNGVLIVLIGAGVPQK